MEYGFQSTHPVRGATETVEVMAYQWPFQSTHPVRGATDTELGIVGRGYISIHAPREGCDAMAFPRHLP